jgi:septum formation protein
MKLILGSASPWRARVLKNAGYVFTTMVADIDERQIRFTDPYELALNIALAKAKELLKKIKEDAILITADQVVSCAGSIYEKPSSPGEAREFLKSYAEHPATTVSALVVINTRNKKEASGVDLVNIRFRRIPDDVIEKLIADGEIFKCAGGFQIEGDNDMLSPYIESIDGAIDSIKGMPLELLKKLLDEVSR